MHTDAPRAVESSRASQPIAHDTMKSEPQESPSISETPRKGWWQRTFR
jgi:hypothetical protein